MGGANIQEDIIIDKTIHKAINSPSAVLKVKNYYYVSLFFSFKNDGSLIEVILLSFLFV